MNMNDPIASLLGGWSTELNLYSVLLRVAVSVIFAAIIGCERANVSARVFTGNAPRKIEQPHQQQRHASACTQCIRQRAEVETQAGTHKKKQQNRRAPIAQLAKEFLVFRQVDIGHAHGHAAQQRRNIRHGTDAAERKQRRNGNNQTVIF